MPAVQGVAVSALDHAAQTQTKRSSQTCLRLQCSHATSASAPACGQRNDQSGTSASRGGRPFSSSLLPCTQKNRSRNTTCCN
eukprot:3943679-Pleurochrysis_carterae.AAC.2